MLLRQVQARPLQGDHLRALRRRGDAPEGAPRAHGPHRPRRSGQPHLVLQGRSQPDRLPARHRSARAREGALLRRLDRDRGRRRGARQGPERPRGQGQVRVASRSTSTATRRSPRSSSGSSGAATTSPRARTRASTRTTTSGPAVSHNWAEEAGLPTLEEVRSLASGIFPELAGTVSTEDPKKIRELVRATATRGPTASSPRASTSRSRPRRSRSRRRSRRCAPSSTQRPARRRAP